VLGAEGFEGDGVAKGDGEGEAKGEEVEFAGVETAGAGDGDDMENKPALATRSQSAGP